MMQNKLPWYALSDASRIPSPALLVYPGRIQENIREMIRIAGSPDRLRPHIKTHKTAEILDMQLKAGITRFKCATIAEAELLGRQGAPDVLVAYQPVGPDPGRLLQLQAAFPETQFAALADDAGVIAHLGNLAGEAGTQTRLFLDLNNGMNRTGIIPGEAAAALYRQIADNPNLVACGLHVYDGHLRQTDPAVRKKACDEAFRQVLELKRNLEESGYAVPVIIAGGSPTFPLHAPREGVELSPGTTLLWDARYGEQFAEMDFLPAAALLCRVVSNPAPGTYCLDLGHKAIAPEMDFPRVALMGLESCRQAGQSEEHLVLDCGKGIHLEIGAEVYGIPMHICPTVAKYPELLVVENNKCTGTWEVAARDYQITI